MGAVTFLMTDVEGSSGHWERDPAGMRIALVRHDELIADAVERHRGHVLKDRGEGDSWFAVFASASDAVAAASDMQTALVDDGRLRVRVGIHSGLGDLRDGTYYGQDVNRCARIRSAGHGGQVLVSEVVAAAVSSATFSDLGEHTLRGFASPERVFQLEIGGLEIAFPPIVTADEIRQLGRSLRVRALQDRLAGDVEVEVTATDAITPSAFRVEVRRNGVIAEVFDQVTIGGPADAVRIVNTSSQLVRIEFAEPVD